MQGVSGLTLTGRPTANAQFEYEVCFKCHADNPERPQSRITRQITQTNTRLEFDPSGPSFHPVAAPGVNRNVPSLIPPMTVATPDLLHGLPQLRWDFHDQGTARVHLSLPAGGPVRDGRFHAGEQFFLRTLLSLPQ